MKKISILDCTLRDGGYVNNWQFKNENVLYIYNKLLEANIDYIEMGYLDSNGSDNSTKIKTLNCIPQDAHNNKLIMINNGDYDIANLPDYTDNSSIIGIRLAFHKKNIEKALKDCKKIKEKGYKLFIQPMLTINYSEDEFLGLIKEVNKIKPYAFYIVDSFGCMDEKDIEKYSTLILKELDQNIKVGLHAHNNLQLCISNVDKIIKLLANKFEVIIDASVYGMGRGAGNLATEILIKHFFDGEIYKIEPLLDIIDNVLNAIRQEKYWGYSIDYYISAIYKCHPSYAKYLVDKQMLNILSIKKIMEQIPDYKKINFDKDFIEQLYKEYQSNPIDEKSAIENIKELTNDKKILLIGPGKSLKIVENEISKLQNEDVVSIMINHYNENIKVDYYFFSNQKRWDMFKKDIFSKNLILTSNLKVDVKNALVFDYKNSVVDVLKPTDNSLLMLLKILTNTNVKKVYLVGFDGFDLDISKNHYDNKLYYLVDKNRINELNKTMKENINYFKDIYDIEFITNSMYK